MNDSVGVFGLGLIGMALSGCLLDSGRRVVGYDPDATRGDLLNEAGGQSEEPARVWQEDLVFSCVFDTDQLAGLIAEAPEREGAYLVSTSTCDPLRMPELAEAASRKGWRFLEVPISGTSAQLSEGDAVLLVAGDPADAQALAPVLSALGRAQHYVGPVGNGNRAKLGVNLVLGLNRAALAEGLVFAERMGLEAGAFLELLQDSAAASAVMKTKGVKMVARDFSAQGRIEQCAKDVDLILSTAAGEGQALPLARTYSGMLRDCFEHGEEKLDNSAVFLAVERARDS